MKLIMQKYCLMRFLEEKTFLHNVIWEKKYSPSNDANYFSDNHDHILVYAKQKECTILMAYKNRSANKRYINPDNDLRGTWKLQILL